MECTIGNLGEEIRQPSNPYANLSQRGLLRCQVNALTAMIPDLQQSPQHFLVVELTLVKVSLFFTLGIDTIEPCDLVKLKLSQLYSEIRWHYIGVTLPEDCTMGAAPSPQWTSGEVMMEGDTKTIE